LPVSETHLRPDRIVDYNGRVGAVQGNTSDYDLNQLSSVEAFEIESHARQALYAVAMIPSSLGVSFRHFGQRYEDLVVVSAPTWIEIQF
jgi:hypothetical protein